MKEIVVISGKGGTGKTSTVAALASCGPRKVLADCDVDAADLHLILDPEIQKTHAFWSGELATIDPDTCIGCGICQEHCRFHAISDTFEVVQEHCEGCGVCEYVCPEKAAHMVPRHCGEWYQSTTRYGSMVHAELGIGEENSGKLVSLVRVKAHDMAVQQGLDTVLIDGSPGIGCPVIASLSNAGLAVIVAEPTISAVHDMERVYQLTTHFNIPAMVLINKADINHELVDKMKAYCQTKKIPLLGTLPYDAAFTEAQVRRQSIVEYDPEGIGQLFPPMWQTMLRHAKTTSD
ncbi:ATP-binding protein [Desulfoplanes formicivorans]|uniref:(4Fe-4S)-binding protein n=1 Tax=Desulfoplanes formicivorans TaxID=1592317 RepID=A0A194AKT6_9BACT|nr:ATP-binding protein [Desulfoplanes formicivorans]GAU09651.1 (4Fe-4S)-binding protein [Desulfoplanes formicivorans]